MNRGLEEAIAALDDRLLHEEKPLHEAEAANRIALYVGNALRHAIELLPQAKRVSVGLALADTLMRTMDYSGAWVLRQRGACAFHGTGVQRRQYFSQDYYGRRHAGRS